MQGLDYQTWRMALVAGLNQKASTRELEPPHLTRAVDVQFDKVGDLQTRYPFAALGADILGGGTISNARRIVENGSEKLLFTKDTLYSWNAQLSKWVSRGTHLAVKVSEQPRFVTTGDQVDCDRAELSNTIVYTWRDGTTVYVAAVDKTTGSVAVSPTAITSAGVHSRPRLVALSTKILLFTVQDGSGGSANGLVVRAIDPADVATGIASAPTNVIVGATANLYYDVTRVIGADQAVAAMRGNPTTSHTVATITAGLVVATSVKARTCDGPIAVSSTPTGTQVQIVRGNGTNVQGDLITIATLADVYTGQAIGTANTTIKQIAAAHRSTQDGGQYRCYAFWANENDRPTALGGETYSNWVDTGNTLGTAAVFVRALSVASRAFDHEGRVYVNLVFAGESDFVSTGTDIYGQGFTAQNTYFLYRDDGFVCAKQAMNRAGGFHPTVAYLPGVALTSGSTVYSWCGTERRIVALGGNSQGYADRGPRDVTIQFDSNEARRCVRLGQTLYITGGEILQYDGRQLVEVGFHYFPYFMELNESLVVGSMLAGDYYYKSTYRWDSSTGETERSTTATHAPAIIASPPGGMIIDNLAPLNVTHKAGIAVEVWRTEKDPSEDAPYHLVTSKDPSVTTGSNRYIVNDTTIGVLDTFTDELVDDDAREAESNPENGGVLENLAPPAATVIAASDTRIFLAGIAGEPHRVWYSKKRDNGEIAAFHDALVIDVPAEGGDITALAMLNDTLVVFRENAIYALPGEGFDNLGGGTNYGPARTISVDIGAVNHESVAVTDKGVVFKSNKGWYLLNRGWSLEYIGAGVMDYDTETPLAVQLVESQHQLRILTSARMLVLDTLGGQWFEWTISDGVHACMWQGTHAYLTSTGPKTQQSTYTAATYGIDVETAWIDLAKMAAFGRVRRIELLGEYRSAHTVRWRLARDYWIDGVDTYFDDRTWTPSPTTVGGPLNCEHGPKIQQVNALKVRLTITPNTAGESAKLSALSFELGFKRGLFRRLPSAQRQ